MEQFGKFELLMKIGSGGMAEIFLARPSGAELSKLVAVKRILPKFTGEKSFKEMFRREGEIALRFRHQAIIAVYELGSIEGKYYLSMEYFPGKTLAQIITALRNSRNAIDIADKLYLIKNIAEALHYIHEFSDHGHTTEIIHRDISPQNILVGFNGTAKLIDFGVAKFTKGVEATSSSSIKGKMAYMSPEQIQGKELSKQTDIFSLGIVLWELLAGKKLFVGSSIDEIRTKLEVCEIPSLNETDSKITDSLNQLCGKALRRNPNDRYMNAAQFAFEIDALMKRMNWEGNPKRIAGDLQFIFADEYNRLCDQLKKHESSSTEADKTLVNSFAAPAKNGEALSLDVEKPRAVSNGTPKRSSLSHYSSQSLSKSQNSIKASRVSRTIRSAAFWSLFVICSVGVGAFISLKSLSKHNADSVAVSAPEPEVTRENVPRSLAAQKDNLSHPTAAAAPTTIATPQPKPIITPAPTVAEVLPKQTPPPANTQPELKVQKHIATPQVVQKAAPAQTSKPAPSTSAVSKKKKTVARTTKPTPAPSRTLEKPAKPTAKIEAAKRTVASKPIPEKAPEKFAYLTVLADPDAQIFVDGNEVGTEVVNSLRVPAEKMITILVLSKSTNQGKVQKIELKPFSRHVIDLSQQN